MDCMRELGTSIAKLTILHATPYPEEASSPSLLTNAHNARKDICVKKLLKRKWQSDFQEPLTLPVDSEILLLNAKF